MSKTTFEKLGIPYEERDGIFYPVLVAGTEKADIDVGKYGRMWIKYIKEEYPMRYKSLVRFGELEERADEVNDTAMQKWGQKAPSKQQSDGKKRHHSDKREKSYGGGKCHQNGKVVAEKATKTVK